MQQYWYAMRDTGLYAPALMQVPSSNPAPTRSPRSAVLRTLLALLLSVCAPLFARPRPPSAHIPLEDLGYQTLSTRWLLSGSSLLSVNFVDDQHLLLSFGVRRLLRRLPNDPVDDDDRTVHTVLLELPSGKVLATTEWRLHDQGQFLWNLGRGRFLLRIHNTLYTFAPLLNLASPEPFVLRQFLHSEHAIQAILLTPESDLLTIETVEPSTQPQARGDSTPTPSGTLISFYRLVVPDPANDHVLAASAGRVLSRGPGEIPLNAAGFLNTLDQGNQTWAFDFSTYTGKLYQLGIFDSTCRPSPAFVTRSEFVAFSCRGGDTQQLLAAFNLRGDEMWQAVLSGSYIAPRFAFSPTSGRFAVSRILVNSAAIPTDELVPAQLNGQTVDVYQIDSGNLLLHIDCSPIARAGQNFALSPNGLSFAVVRDEAVEIYTLPPLSDEDKAAVQRAEATAPTVEGVPVNLSSMGQSTSSQQSSPSQRPTAAAHRPASTSPVNPAAQDPQTSQSDQVNTGSAATPSASSNPPTDSAQDPNQPQPPRKPPTLYNPDEKPQ